MSLFPLLPLLFLSGCAREKTPAPAEVVAQVAREKVKEAREGLIGLQGAVMKGGELRGGDSQGRPLWSVGAREIRTSGSAALGTTPKTATLIDARATLYRAGKPESTLRAAQMVFFNTPNGVRLQMSKGVTGESVGPWTGKRGAIKIAAPRADVDIQKRLIAASGGVRMSQGNLKISAQTLRSQTALQKVDVKGKVRGNDGNGQIEADSALYDWQKGSLNAQKVVASQNGTKISGDLLRADTNASRGTLTGRVTAKSERGTAAAPRVDFAWKRDQIIAFNARFDGQDGNFGASRLQTDSKLRVASASDFVAEKDGAILRASFADGFDGLNRVRGRGVSFSRGDLRFSAPRADASRRGQSWILKAAGGARGENASGKVSAPSVMWDESSGRVEASGGVQMQKDGAILSGNTLNSDSKFENAILRGNVRGKMQDGSTLVAGALEKRGERFFASNRSTARFQSKGALGVLTIQSAKIEAAADGSSAIASGGVVVSSAAGATARAPRAIYNRAKNQIVASGGVDFHDPSRGLKQRGDTLVADLALKQITLSNVRGQGSSTLFEGKKLF
ncbi:MAG TPA: LPS export ABC transporter periplasmic protein LptC [Abditibacterium sp.]